MKGLFSKILFTIIAIALSFNVYSQEKKYHIVKEGDNIRSVSLKYSITPYELIKANPNISEPLTAGIKLIIPQELDEEVIESKSVEIKYPDPEVVYHKVLPKETLYSLAKKYDTTIEKIYEFNPSLSGGLKIDMVLTIVRGKSQLSQERVLVDTSKFYVHVVKPKETQWGLCHKYGLSPQEFFKMNPAVADGLKIGDTIIIDKSFVKAIAEPNNNNNYKYYEVQPKDTKYGLGKKFEITIDSLEYFNPAIKEGLKIGMLLKIPIQPREVYDTQKFVQNTSTNLPNDSLLTFKEKINRMDELKVGKVLDVALMLPFYLNENKIFLEFQTASEARREEIIAENDNKEPVLYHRSAIAFDFYNGALLALDSLKRLGLSVRLKVYDTERSLDKIKDLMDKEDFSKVDVVIGPLYTKNAEYVADRLKYDNVLVLSPLSKKHDIENRFNLIQAMPSDYTTKNLLINKMVQSDTDTTHYFVIGGVGDEEDVQFAVEKLYSTLDSNRVSFFLSPNNLLNKDSLKVEMEPSYDNVLLMASNDNVMLTDALTALNSVRDTLPNRIFLMEKPKSIEKLESRYLNNTKMIYPEDYYVDYHSAKTDDFVRSYLRKNTYMPSVYSFRGFDVVYDVLLSLGRKNNIPINITDSKARLIQGKFDYVRQPFGGFFNKGVFLLQYKDWNLVDVEE